MVAGLVDLKLGGAHLGASVDGGLISGGLLALGVKGAWQR